MITRLDHGAKLRGLKTVVEAELAEEEAAEPVAGEAAMYEAADAEREKTGLRNLLGAIDSALDGEPRYPVAAANEDVPGRPVDRPTGPARYGRMFRDLEPLGAAPQLLMREGSAGGVCDATAALDESNGGDDDATEAAGWPFFGQLVAHDITADRSPIAGGAAPETLRNARAPMLNLEILYSDGPIGSPFLFDATDPAKFLLGPDGGDVPRNLQGVALIGDPRNDVHLFTLSLHVALLQTHNRIVDRLRSQGVPEGSVFDEARRTLTWHYEWVVVNDFLPRLVGEPLVQEVITDGGRWFAPKIGEAYIPLEFADAAYRYGHGQIRHAYQLTADGPAVPVFPDLVSFGPLPIDRRLDLTQIFDVAGRPPAQRAKRLDGHLAASLIGLPEKVTGAVDVDAYRSLAVRDLVRGETTELPSGEKIAELMGVDPLTRAELGYEWGAGTPLWYYILKEAEHRADGNGLGPVGGRIVTEVLIGLLRADSLSYLSQDPGWQPNLPAAGPRFGLTDLLIPADSV